MGPRNATELAAALRRYKELKTDAQGWAAYGSVRKMDCPAVRVNYSSIYVNAPGREYLKWEKGGHVLIEFSPTQRKMRISKSPTKEGLAMNGGGTLPARPIFRAFGLFPLPAMDLLPGEKHPLRKAELVDGSLIIDVGDLMAKEEARD